MSSFEQRKWTDMSTAEIEGHALWPVKGTDMSSESDDELRWGVFGPVNTCCGVTASVGHDLYCENRVAEPKETT
jgi:hypothetical protein